jgi:hypothetical protein
VRGDADGGGGAGLVRPLPRGAELSCARCSKEVVVCRPPPPSWMLSRSNDGATPRHRPAVHPQRRRPTVLTNGAGEQSSPPQENTSVLACSAGNATAYRMVKTQSLVAPPSAPAAPARSTGRALAAPSSAAAAPPSVVATYDSRVILCDGCMLAALQPRADSRSFALHAGSELNLPPSAPAACSPRRPPRWLHARRVALCAGHAPSSRPRPGPVACSPRWPPSRRPRMLPASSRSVFAGEKPDPD